MDLKHVRSILRARNREFLRDRSSWAWNIIFPFVLIAGIALVFGDENQPIYKIGVFPAVNTTNPFFATKHIHYVDITNLDEAIDKVARHQFDLVLDSGDNRYWINDSSPKGYFAEKILVGSSVIDGDVSAVGGVKYSRQTVSGKAIRYVDWVLPGVLGMNMMFSCLFGIGYVIVRYRKSGVLKRLKATPLSAFEFVTAQVLSRLWLVVSITVFVFLGTHWVLDFTMNGSYFTLLLILLTGSISLISLGLLFASYTSSEELAGGLLNMATWPMMILSGVWYSLEGAHKWVQMFADILPLTHVIVAARAVMIDGAGLLAVAHHLGYLFVLALIFLTLGARFFKWD